MKLKLDEKGNVVVQDGKPVYVHDDGKELPFDAAGTVATITRLNGEAKTHREGKEAAEGKLKLFEGISDPEAARKAIETVANLEEGKLITAGKVEEIKAAARKTFEEAQAAANKASGEEMAKKDKTIADLTGSLYSEKIGGSFSRSKYISEKIAIPADMLQARFGQNFKVEDGKIVAYGPDGNKVYSRTKHGELADFEEAIEQLVDVYPQRDHILKGSGSGTGAQGGRQTQSGAKTLPRSEFDKLSPTERPAKIADGFVVVDG